MEQTALRTVAPCGIHCKLCLAFLRDKNKCLGCWGPNNNKPYHCSVCSIKNCEQLSKTNTKFCYDCVKYPCQRIKQLDKRYKIKYNVSNINNLRIIKESGLENFVELEKEKWTCKFCGGTISMHRGHCINCNPAKKE